MTEQQQQPEQLRQRQSEPHLLSVPQTRTGSRHQKRHSEFNLAGLGASGDESSDASSSLPHHLIDDAEPVTCHRADGHEHLDNVMADSDIPMGVEQLANCLLKDGPWFRDFLQRRRTFGLEVGEFESGGSGSGAGVEDVGTRRRRPGDRRDIRYWLRINYAIGPKQTLVEETQTYVWCEPGKVHIVDCEVHNRDIPYGTSFHTLNRMCLTSRGPGRSHLTITSRTVFTRHVFLAKGFIESNVREGSLTYFRLMVDTLLDPSAGTTPINDDDAGDRRPGAAAVAAAAANVSGASSSSAAVASSTPTIVVKRQDSADARRRRRPSATSSTSAAAASASANAATATATGRRSSTRTAKRSATDGQRLLLVCLLLAIVLMLGCLVSLHFRFQSLDNSLDRLRSIESGRAHCAEPADLSSSSATGRPAAMFTREQLDIWRRTLDETMGSLDGLIFELRRLANAGNSASSVCSSPHS